jgi:hypothetical protein
MPSDVWTVTAVIPIIGAAVSTAGALYVGRQNRKVTHDIAHWQSDLADAVVREQLYLALASRARHVAECAGETARTLMMWAQVDRTARSNEVGKRMARLDGAFYSFLEAWSDVVGRDLATPEMGAALNRLADQLEVVRLGLNVEPSDIEGHVSALSAASELARSYQAECTTVARQDGRPG